MKLFRFLEVNLGLQVLSSGFLGLNIFYFIEVLDGFQIISWIQIHLAWMLWGRFELFLEKKEMWKNTIENVFSLIPKQISLFGGLFTAVKLIFFLFPFCFGKKMMNDIQQKKRIWITLEQNFFWYDYPEKNAERVVSIKSQTCKSIW